MHRTTYITNWSNFKLRGDCTRFMADPFQDPTARDVRGHLAGRSSLPESRGILGEATRYRSA